MSVTFQAIPKRWMPGIIGALAMLTACSVANQATPTVEPPPPTSTPQPTATATTSPTPTRTPAPTATPTPAQAPGYDQWRVYEGNWSGGWQNQTFGSTGGAEAVVVVNDDGTAQITLDLGGFVFGAIDPPAFTLSGAYTEAEAVFSLGQDPTFGDMSVTFAATGEVSASFSNLMLQGGTMEVTGTFSPERIDLNYTVKIGSVTAGGILSLEHN